MISLPAHSIAARLFTTVAAGLVLSSCGASDESIRHGGALAAPQPSEATGLYDHHVHFMSDDAAGLVRAYFTELGLQDAPMFEATRGAAAADIIAVMDSFGVDRSLLISSANTFATTLLSSSVRARFGLDDPAAELAAVVRENDYLAREVARHPHRLVGVCSVNPFRPYARAEAGRCARELGLPGLKVHLSQSGGNLRDPDHLDALRGLFQEAEALGVAVVIHLPTLPPADFDAALVEAFIREVLVHVPRLDVQLAHLAGGGAYSRTTDATLAAFQEAFRTGLLDRERYTFDISMAVPEGVRGTSVSRSPVWAGIDSLPDRMRSIGLDRFVFGSDWPASPMGRTYLEDFAHFLPLPPAEIEQIAANQGPLFGAGSGESSTSSSPAHPEINRSRPVPATRTEAHRTTIRR